MTNPLVKHYLISLLIGALTFIASHVLGSIPSDVAGSLSVVITYFVHHYLENADSTNVATTPTDGGAPGTGSSPPGTTPTAIAAVA